MRIAAVGDIHVKKTDEGKWKDFFAYVSDHADVLLVCGDLTDTGHKDEAATMAEELKALSVPIIAVLGNHDYEQDMAEEIIVVLKEANVCLLQGSSVTLDGVGFAGAKGFCGGFNRYMMPRFGERINKEFVQETVEESLKLDQALVRLEGDGVEKKIVLLHYSPIQETVEGEPPQIQAFLGSSRLESPINERQASMVFHGHAHLGKLHGHTSTGIEVYNVARHILEREGYLIPVFIKEF